ncbi:hypothetical protein YC2023_071409 [Brassica napus]
MSERVEGENYVSNVEKEVVAEKTQAVERRPPNQNPNNQGQRQSELSPAEYARYKAEECATLSACSTMGISSPRTIKLKGMVRDVKAVRGIGVCRNVTLVLGNYSVTSDFLPLELNNVDVILGIQWLETLGETRVNWKLQIMKIPVERRLVELQGEPGLCSSEGSEEPKLTSKALEFVLEGFSQVFEEPVGPPSRGREHAINLTQGSNPVSVRPFRYPQAQKAEIERQPFSLRMWRKLCHEIRSYKGFVMLSQLTPSSFSDFALSQGKLLQKGKMVIPKQSPLRRKKMSQQKQKVEGENYVSDVEEEVVGST